MITFTVQTVQIRGHNKIESQDHRTECHVNRVKLVQRIRQSTNIHAPKI